MSEFKTTLDVRMLPEMDDQSWMLTSPLTYHSDRMGGEITVPTGFITNFVSFEALKNVGQHAAVIWFGASHHTNDYVLNDKPQSS